MSAVNEPPEPRPAPSAPPERPVLRRSADDRLLFGVAGGLARYLGIDATLVRVAFALLALFGGSGILLYLIGLVAIPPERPGEVVGAGAPTGALSPAVVIGGALVLLGSVALARQVVPALDWVVGPLLLILAGVLVLLGSRR